jgi:hypothetical protein
MRQLAAHPASFLTITMPKLSFHTVWTHSGLLDGPKLAAFKSIYCDEFWLQRTKAHVALQSHC